MKKNSMEKGIRGVCVSDKQTHSDKRRASISTRAVGEGSKGEDDAENEIISVQVVYGCKDMKTPLYEEGKEYYIDVS